MREFSARLYHEVDVLYGDDGLAHCILTSARPSNDFRLDFVVTCDNWDGRRSDVLQEPVRPSTFETSQSARTYLISRRRHFLLFGQVDPALEAMQISSRMVRSLIVEDTS